MSESSPKGSEAVSCKAVSTNPVATNAVATMSLLRMAIGASALIIPQTAFLFSGVPLTADGAKAARLFGVRDFVLGALLWTARIDPKVAVGGGCKYRELRRALWAGVFTDLVDAAGFVVGAIDGSANTRTFLSLFVGPLVFAGVGAIGLMGN